MGVLEDAIREHIELKRRHGASDEELEQQEAEALGPARRDFAAEESAEPADEAQAEVEATEPVGEESPPAVPEGETRVDEQLPAEPPAVREEAEEGDDVLEDTPDFLQETPEHDRLWFEQKPPRDFDFD